VITVGAIPDARRTSAVLLVAYRAIDARTGHRMSRH